MANHLDEHCSKAFEFEIVLYTVGPDIVWVMCFDSKLEHGILVPVREGGRAVIATDGETVRGP